MITPIEIQSKSFKSGMGYSKADVDSFIQTVAADFESLYRENLELKDKINICYYFFFKITELPFIIFCKYSRNNLV